MASCTQQGCGGTVLADGYCDTCGFAAASASAAHPPAVPPAPTAAPRSASPGAMPPPPAPKRQVDMAVVGNSCKQSGCGGTVLADGYCNTCGLLASASAPPTAPAGASAATSPASGSGAPATASIAAPTAPVMSSRLGATGGSSESRRSSATRRLGGVGAGLGMGLIDITPTPAGDPASAVMSAEKVQTVLGVVPEDERHCSSCGRPVGRSDEGREGRITGFCGTCRTKFDFVTNAPALEAGDMVAGQYEILGPIAHGGMGWIYLGRDTAVSNRWVVLKGLLNEHDADAIASAVAERQFLAQIEHGSIVNIYNFVTWGGAGYIVMEYVDGQSLNSKLKDRRQANGGQPDPLPVTDAIAYLLGVLPALGYLHRLGLVYNDLKPANIMATGNEVKLIDVGGVMRSDDDHAAIFGTQGFQAPEVAAEGPSIASDLYTVGRTLAVMTLTFRFHTGEYLYDLPTPAEQPVFAQWESFHRFLLKATARHPDDRFQTAEEMTAQLAGVLREIVSVTNGAPHPVPSTLFDGDQLTELLAKDTTAADQANWRSLPRPRLIQSDPAAAFLLDLPDDDPNEALNRLSAAVTEGAVAWTVEGAVVNARLLVDIGDDPHNVLDVLVTADPWDWRIRWFESLFKLSQGDAAGAAEGFSQVWTQVPGEIAPKLAVAVSAEAAGEVERAAALYQSIVDTDPTYVSAAFGLARCRVAAGDRSGAVEAFGSVPVSSAGYFDAQLATARTLTTELPGGDRPDPGDLATAAATVERLQLDSVERARISVDILEDALVGVQSGSLKEAPQSTLFGEPLTETGLRRGLERTYRELARVAPGAAERNALVDKANAVRPLSLL